MADIRRQPTIEELQALAEAGKLGAPSPPLPLNPLMLPVEAAGGQIFDYLSQMVPYAGAILPLLAMALSRKPKPTKAGITPLKKSLEPAKQASINDLAKLAAEVPATKAPTPSAAAASWERGLPGPPLLPSPVPRRAVGGVAAGPLAEFSKEAAERAATRKEAPRLRSPMEEFLGRTETPTAVPSPISTTPAVQPPPSMSPLAGIAAAKPPIVPSAAAPRKMTTSPVATKEMKKAAETALGAVEKLSEIAGRPRFIKLQRQITPESVEQIFQIAEKGNEPLSSVLTRNLTSTAAGALGLTPENFAKQLAANSPAAIRALKIAGDNIIPQVAKKNPEATMRSFQRRLASLPSYMKLGGLDIDTAKVAKLKPATIRGKKTGVSTQQLNYLVDQISGMPASRIAEKYGKSRGTVEVSLSDTKAVLRENGLENWDEIINFFKAD